MEITAYRLGDVTGWSLEPASAQRDWMDATLGKRAYRCLPLTIANQCGWVVRCPHTFSASWSGDADPAGTYITPVDVQPTFPGQVHTNFGLGIVSIALPWLFRTPPGYGILVTGAINTYVLHAAPLSGVIETDWAPYSFTMNWRIVTPNVQVTFHRDTPVCMLIPFQLDNLDRFEPRMTVIAENPELMAAHKSWSNERRADSEANTRRPADAQKYRLRYLKGEDMAGQRVSEHRSSLRMEPFVNQPERWPGGEPHAGAGPTAAAPKPTPAPTSAPDAPVTAERVFSSPELYLTDFDPASGRTMLGRMSPQTYRDSPALDHRMLSLGPPVYQATMAAVGQMLKRANPVTRPVSLVLRTMGVDPLPMLAGLEDAGATVYRDPLVLGRVADMKRQSGAAGAPVPAVTWREAFTLLHAMYGRTWNAGDASLVLATDICLPLVEDFLEAHEHARVLIIHAPVTEALPVILGAPDFRQRCQRAAVDASRLPGIAPVDASTLSDVQAGALVWAVQMRFVEEVKAAAPDRVMTLAGADAPGRAAEIGAHLHMRPPEAGTPRAGAPPRKLVTPVMLAEAREFVSRICGEHSPLSRGEIA